MKNKIFKKYFLVATVTLLIFIVGGMIFTSYLSESLRPRRTPIPPVFIAKLIDRLGGDDKLAGVRQLEEIQQPGRSSLSLYSAEGTRLYGNMGPEYLTSQIRGQLQAAYEFAVSENLQTPPSERRPWIAVPFLRPPPPPREDTVIRLSGEPAFYVLMSPPSPPPMRTEGVLRYMPVLGPLSLLISLLLGVAVTISLIYASVRKKVNEADWVLSRLQQGDLKARFRVNRRDEFGEAMLRFNRMADEIEALVERLRIAETARNRILQELAHDLRTPVASLKNLLETLDRDGGRLNDETRRELLQFSLREVDYFAQLVEDLLLLAQVDEPNLTVQGQRLNLVELVDEVIADCLVRPLYREKGIAVRKEYESETLSVDGQSSLIYRMLRNILENAFSFTRKEVLVEIFHQNNILKLRITDDGPGLTEQQLVNYGERKQSREIVTHQSGKRLSVGLGSVIIRKIARIHGANVSIYNARDESGRISGAVLTISFERDTMRS